MEAVELKSVLNRVLELLGVPYPMIRTVYDNVADVLYFNFKKPSHADDSELTDDDLIIRYDKGAVAVSPCSMRARWGLGVGTGCMWFCSAFAGKWYGLAVRSGVVWTKVQRR